MKPPILSAPTILLICLAAAGTTAAQDTSSEEMVDAGFSGTVVYQETVKFDFQLPPQMERMRERIEDTRTAAVVLIFNESSSLSQLAPEAEQEAPPPGRNDQMARRMRRFRMFGQRENNATFIDFENETAIQRREFLDRVFLVDGAPKPQWKLTSDVSEFLGYQCHRAIATVDTLLVEAWFTPEIPVSAGPDEYYGLPGLILVLTTNEGNHSYVAAEVSLRPVAAEAIAPPTEGRKVTREEFDEIVAEKRKEMESQRGNRPFIRRRN